jgi:hypothetical protein
VQCVNQKAGGDTDRLWHVIVFAFIALRILPLPLDEYGN